MRRDVHSRHVKNSPLNLGAEVTSAILMALLLLVTIPANMASFATSSTRDMAVAATDSSSANSRACNCVIFRLDDVQDYWLVPVQTAIIDKFIEKNASLDIALIMNWVGGDPALVSKLREASFLQQQQQQQQQNSSSAAQVIEMSLHGWNHIDYGKISFKEQYDTLKAANAKMQDLFGRKSAILVMPFNSYNEDTLKAMNQLGLKVISAEFDTEMESIYDPDNPSSQDNKVYKAIPGSEGNITDAYGLYHMPQTVGFYTYDSVIPTKTPLSLIEKKINETIGSYGYAVVTLHPQDFTVKNADNTPTKNLSLKEIDDLGILIDWVRQNNHAISTFSNAAKVPQFPIVDNVPPDISPPEDKALVSPSPLTHVELGSPTLSDNVDPHPIAVNNAPPLGGFPQGTTRVTWSAADKAGNIANATQYVTIYPDADDTHPLVAINSPINATAVKGDAPIVNIPVRGTAFDDYSGVKMIEIRTNGTGYKAVTQEQGVGGDSSSSSDEGSGLSNWNATVTLSHPGTTEIIARATDFFGNQQWATIQVQVLTGQTAIGDIGTATTSPSAEDMQPQLAPQ